MIKKKPQANRFPTHLLINAFVILLSIMVLGLLLLIVQTSYAAYHQLQGTVAKLDNAIIQLNQNIEESAETFNSYTDGLQAEIDVLGYLLDHSDNQYSSISEIQKLLDIEVIGLYHPNGTLLNGSVVSRGIFAKETMDTVFELAGEGCYIDPDNYIYNAYRLSSGDLLIGRTDARDFFASQNLLSSIQNVFDPISFGDGGFAIAVDQETQLIDYVSPSCTPLHKGDPFVVPKERVGTVQFQGVPYAYVKADTDEFIFIALLPYEESSRGALTSVLLQLSISAVILLLIFLYSSFVREDLSSGRLKNSATLRFGKKTYSQVYVAKIVNIFVLGIISLFSISMFIQCVFTLSHQRMRSEDLLTSVQYQLELNDMRIERIESDYRSEYIRRADELSFAFKANPSLVTHENAADFADVAQVQSLFVFNGDGKTVATNSVYRDFSLNTRPTAQSYAFWDIIHGYANSLVQDAQNDDSSQHQYIQYIGVTRRDAPGLVQIGINPETHTRRLATTQMSFLLDHISVENNGFVFALDAATNTLLSWPDHSMIGRSGNVVGLTETARTDGYSGYQTLNGINYYVVSKLCGDKLIYAVAERSAVFDHAILISLIVTLNGLVFILLLSGIVALNSGKQGNRRKIFSYSEKFAFGEFSMNKSSSSALFRRMNAEQKLQKVISFLLGVLALFIFLRFQLLRTRTHSSVLAYIMSRDWERGLNLFSISYIIVLSLQILSVSLIVRRIILMFSTTLGSHAETVGRLLDNFIKYTSVLGTFFAALYYLGINTTTLLASAGVLTLGISLGAQSLVADIIAGIFIIFENQFRVGDVVTIDGWRGIVEEIGIRTTKVASIPVLTEDSDIKIFRNSLISGVVNMSEHVSLAVCEVGIDYSESIERVEAILAEELPKIREHVPGKFLDDPKLLGLQTFSDSSMVLRIGVYINEQSRGSATRALNREVKMIFDHYGINIPFPQVVLSQREEPDSQK